MYCVQVWAPQYNRQGHTSESPVKVRRVLKGLEYLTYAERLRQMGLFSLERRRLGGGSHQCI